MAGRVCDEENAMTDDMVAQLTAELAELRRELADVRAEVAAMQPAKPSAQLDPADPLSHDVDPAPQHPGWSRRAMILGGAAATVGAVNALRVAPPAAAAVGAMQYGAINRAEDGTTSLTSTSTNYTLGVANSAPARDGGYPFCMMVHSEFATALSVTATHGVGIRVYSGDGAALQVNPGPNSLPGDGTWATGSVVMTQGGEMWLCVTGGSPGQWRLLGSPAAAGGFIPITPARVYDSRAPQPSGGAPLLAGSNRVISVRDARDLITGAVITPNLVPAGTKAITVNVTITETVGAGHVALVPGVALTYSASAINWDRSGQNLANGLTLSIDAARNLRAFCRNGDTHVIIDVTGYFRAV